MVTMLYRIAIQSVTGGRLYYLSSDKDFPETDCSINLETIQFLSNLNTTHAHTFSSKELAKESIKSLPFPYNEKAITLPVESTTSQIVSTIFYRVVKRKFNVNRLLWANVDKSFSEQITPNAAHFSTQEEAENFIETLVGLNKRYSYVVKIKDYGEPDYKFDAEFIVGGKTISNISDLPGLMKIR